jgi:S-adenosylmethionine hydrolase
MIALFTDFGWRDAYVAQLKGAILGINPHASLIDLTHDVEPFNIRQAAYLLERSSRYFPTRTIFVAVVDPSVGSTRRPILIRTLAEKIYVGPDNGVFTRVVQRDNLRAAYVLRESAYFSHAEISRTFHGRDVFGPVAAHLTLGVEPQCFGPRAENLCMLSPPSLRVVGQSVQGEILHIDHFGNVVTNITPECFEDLRSGQQVCITIARKQYQVPFCTTYVDGSPGLLICLFNSDTVFEIAVPQGNAATKLGVQVGMRVVVEW